MRLILSRKGFDSASGGCPSPILEDGSMLALPIPDRSSTVRYAQLDWNGTNVGELVERLTKGRQRATYFAHLDPDVRAQAMPRTPGWRPSLGQEGPAQSHLRNQSVGVGDLFLFWGLFQRVTTELRPLGRPVHALWGWLQVGRVADVETDVAPAIASPDWSWASGHPHVGVRSGQRVRRSPNALYVAAEELIMPCCPPSSVPGAGVFDRFRDDLQLTADPTQSLSTWSLPCWFAPGRRTPLTFHGSADRWTIQNDRALLKTVGRGQEFVLDTQEYPEAVEWAWGLVSREAESRRRHSPTES